MSVRHSTSEPRRLARRGSRRVRRRLAMRAFVTGAVTALVVGGALGTLPVLVAGTPALADDELSPSTVTKTTSADALVADGSPFPDLAVTVSQTRDLVQQGIRISYDSGVARASQTPTSGSGGANYLQIAQCWGEDPEHPGHPDRRTCQYGGTLITAATRDGTVLPQRVVDEDQAYTAYTRILGQEQGYTSIPFVGYNSAQVTDESAGAEFVVSSLETVNDVIKQKTGDAAVDVNTNQFFTQYTTNEIAWAPFAADGTGSVPFEIQTVSQSTGLSCGLPLTQADGSVVGKSCWLVIIPRGVDSGSASTVRSGLWWDAWEHHIAFELDFAPVGVRCEIGEAEKQMAGSELISRAAQSWQPELCDLDGGAPFVLREAYEADALLEASETESSALAITTRPLDLNQTAYTADPVVYAPLAFGAITVSLSIDRNPSSNLATADQLSRARLPLTDMKLTPRLLAKLLTASYYDAVPSGTGADKSHLTLVDVATGEPTTAQAPRNLLFDPDFRAINDPEWAVQAIGDVAIADALVPNGRSDLAYRVWEYILADDEARVWLEGSPDPWGMRVNHWYSTNDDVNPNGKGLALPASNFPKADPTEKADTTTSSGLGSGPINLVTWRPFTSGFADGAYQVLRGDGKTLGEWNALASPPRFVVEPKKALGLQAVIAMSTSPAAEQFQTVTAALRNSAGLFVTPTTAALEAARAAMTPVTSQPSIIALDFAGSAAQGATTAYPLTVPLYAALNPDQEDEETRTAYATFIRYAVTDGQAPGTDRGQLPPGYAPLTQAQASQALSAAAIIEDGRPPTPTPSPTTPPATTTTSTTTSSSYVVPSTSSAAAPPAETTDDTADVTFTPVGTTPADPETPITAAAVPIGLAAGIAAAIAVPVVSRVRGRP